MTTARDLAVRLERQYARLHELETNRRHAGIDFDPEIATLMYAKAIRNAKANIRRTTRLLESLPTN